MAEGMELDRNDNPKHAEQCSLLQLLKTPVVPRLTKEMKEEAAIEMQGRKLWEDVLEECRIRRGEASSDKEDEEHSDEEDEEYSDEEHEEDSDTETDNEDMDDETEQSKDDESDQELDYGTDQGSGTELCDHSEVRMEDEDEDSSGQENHNEAGEPDTERLAQTAWNPTFLGIPMELRMMIYELYFATEKADPFRPPDDICRPAPGSKCRPLCLYRPRSRRRIRHGEEIDLLNDVHEELVEEPYQSGKISDLIYRAYCEHKSEYERLSELYPEFDDDDERDLWPHDSDEDDHDSDGIEISEFGHIDHNLPMLSLTCRQVFVETWSEYLAKHREYIAEVSKFNFKPLFRFARTLKLLCGYMLTQDHLLVNLSNPTDRRRSPWATELKIHRGDFANLRQLYQKHWLEGFPLWQELDITPYHQRKDRDNSHSQKGLLQHWARLVRRAAAVHRIDPDTWTAVTMPFVRECAEHYGDDESHDFLERTHDDDDLQAVKGALWMIGLAVEYRLGHKGEWSYADDFYDNDRFLIQDDSAREATIEEIDFVNLVEMYGKVMESTLRAKLGEEYEAWEESWDDAAVPDEGVI